MICFHKWTKWEDVNLSERLGGVPMDAPYFIIRQVITQQRRCTKCNLVKTRSS